MGSSKQSDYIILQHSLYYNIVIFIIKSAYLQIACQMGLFELDSAIASISSYILLISPDDYIFQTLFYLLQAQVLFSMYQINGYSLSVFSLSTAHM